MANNQLNPSSSSQSSSLSLPTALTARKHLGSSKKSDNRNVHPGYSMFDWNRFCEREPDLTGLGGRLISVSPEELAKHCTEDDAWTAVRGRVYNITPFMKFHPGGKKQLMRGAGNDCTKLFDKIHVWVNSESILKKCIVGYYEGDQTRASDTPESSPNSLAPAIARYPAPQPPSSDDGVDVVTIAVDVPAVSVTVPDVVTPTPVISVDNEGSEEEIRGDSVAAASEVKSQGAPEETTNIPLSTIQSAPIQQEAELEVGNSGIVDLEQRMRTLEQEMQRLSVNSQPAAHRASKWGSSRFWGVLTLAGLIVVPLVVAFMYRSKRS